MIGPVSLLALVIGVVLPTIAAPPGETAMTDTTGCTMARAQVALLCRLAVRATPPSV